MPNRGYSPDCHLNIVGCLFKKRLTKGGGEATQGPPQATPLSAINIKVIAISLMSIWP